MQKYSSVREGLAAMQQFTLRQRKVGALLTFQDTGSKIVDVCFLFESLEAPVQQLIKKMPDMAIKGEAPEDMPHLLAARNTAMRSAISVLGEEELGLQTPHGHAEEALLRDFDACCGQVKDIRDVTIYLTHSPCTQHDQAPSDNMQGWPPSCTAKFSQLAASHAKWHFSICYSKAFGAMEGNTDAEKALKTLSGGLSNLSFVHLG